MKLLSMTRLPLLLLAAQPIGGSSTASVQKVIQMLTNMEATSKQEKKDEEVAFAKFSTWCEGETENLKADIVKNKETIELLSAEIGKLETDANALGEAIADLNNKVTNNEAKIKEETARREKDKDDYMAEQKDYGESVDALERAIAVLMKQNYDRTGADEALLQVTRNERVPEKAKSLIAAFLGMDSRGQQVPEQLSYEAPEANAYEFQSSGIVDMLKKLRDEFKGKLSDSQKEEMNSKHAYDMILQDLTDSIENANKEINEKTSEKERKSEKAAISKRDLASTQNVKAENESTLKATTIECREKTLSYKEKQNLRGEEIEAIGKAIEILQSPEVAGNSEKYLAMAQSKRGTAFVQMGETSNRMEGIHRRIREFLSSEANRLHSQRLGLLAQKVSADPFAKVKKLIEDMITRLLEEANEDASHEGFCDKEMGKSKITRNKLSEEIDGLQAAVEEGKATIASLAESTAELSKEVAELSTSMSEATDLRKEDKEKNAQTMKDAVAAQKALMAAMSVLKDFYKKALTATALVQQPKREFGLKTKVRMGSEEWAALANPDAGAVDTGHKEGMQTFGEVETGQQDEAGGVMALLEVIQSDFATLEADTKASEAESERTYKQFMAECKKSMAVKEKKIAMNKSDKAEAESKLQEDVADMKSNQDELLAAERYYKKLVPQCLDQGMTFEERTAARKAEIQSLKEALEILGNES